MCNRGDIIVNQKIIEKREVFGMNLPKVYEPSEYESTIYELWERSQAFRADPTSDKERFSIAMPPPNETGTLSIGHSLFLTLQDILARYNRLKGKDVLWLPGTDHAALAVNAIIEKQLAEEGTDKHKIGRDVFLNKTRDFVAGSRDTMLGQMKAMGASTDWSRLRYTLDPALSRSVSEVFVRMYKDGIIYRGHRIVNWDPNLETNVSDDEVEYKEEQAELYTFKFGPFEIATARPETKFADKYVVIHPDDKRYAKYKHGDTFETEWINGKVTGTIIKDDVIDPSFGTGVMTITPWHSHVDFEIAERHGLDKVQVIDFDGRLLPVAGEFAGMPIAEARPEIVAKLKKKGLLVKTDKNYLHNIAVNERGKGIIEPQIRLQWFIDVNKEVVEWKGKKQSLKQILQSVIKDEDIKILPNRFEKTYFHWIDNLRDWCISRQIWWGHRIPAWYRTDAAGETETYVGIKSPEDDGEEGWHEWSQDPDTLDTWFSSALWTWSTLIDPGLAEDYSLSLEDLLEQSPDFQAYHPTTVMETGWDILFFWVARMILSTTYATKQLPFKTVYLHGMIRAEDGKKMSKSRPESIINPMEVIPKYGTDALRTALVWGNAPGQDMSWNWQKIESTRNFANKLWNIARFIEGVVGDDYKKGREVKPKTVADHWMLIKLQQSTDKIAKDLDNYRFSEAFDTLYHTIWDEFADWYIEASKADQNPFILAYCLEVILKTAHPFMPFITETIWQTLRWEEGSLLVLSTWPELEPGDIEIASAFETIRAVVSESRAISRNLELSKPKLLHTGSELLTEHNELIIQLARLDTIEQVADPTGLKLTQTSQGCWIEVDESTARNYLTKLEQKQTAEALNVERLIARLANKSYVDNAPAHLVAETKGQLEDARTRLEQITAEIDNFSIEN